LAAAVSAAVDTAAGFTPDHHPKQSWDKAMGWFTSSFPLLGGLAAGFRIVADAEICRRYDIDIAAVDATCAEIYVNPLAGLDEPQWRFVLAHELLHAGLRHGQRALGRQPYLWNVACDYVVNGWLTQMRVGEPPDGVLIDLALQDLSAEAVYDRMTGDLRTIRKLATLRGVAAPDILGEPLPLPRESFGAIDLDEFYRRALTTGLAYHQANERGLVPAGLVEEIRVLDQPPPAWDVALARWFEAHVRAGEPVRSYARPSRRQAATPDIPRPGHYFPTTPELQPTFGVVLDTSGSMSGALLGKALGAIAAYAHAKDVPAARVVYCDAAPHDAGYLPVDDIVDRVTVTGRGGTVLQPAIRFLERSSDFPRIRNISQNPVFGPGL
jgi:predicted metal-dependent peptidase